MTFNTWIDTFLNEKQISRDDMLTVEGASGANHIPTGMLVDMIKTAPKTERDGIKAMMVGGRLRSARQQAGHVLSCAPCAGGGRMTLNRFRSKLYAIAKLLGDVQAATYCREDHGPDYGLYISTNQIGD